MSKNKLTNEMTKKLKILHKEVKHGDNLNQSRLNEIIDELKRFEAILPRQEKNEIFNLVDNKGEFKHLFAPRWICHLIGLRHKSVHVLLKWNSPTLGKVFIFQIRSWTKSDSPGHIDISIGGHVLGNNKNHEIESIYREMEEELGITKIDLKNRRLHYIAGYEYAENRKKDYFYNVEWRDIFEGEIMTQGLDKIHFNDKEVVGLYLCPENEARNILDQSYLPIASALKFSLPYCLK